MNIMTTGACGFIGSAFLDLVSKDAGVNVIVNIDKMTYAANQNLPIEVQKKVQYRHYKFDINNPIIVDLLKAYNIDYLVHFAAESHVDNSIKSPDEFVTTNINGTFNLLECARKYGNLKKFIHVSTDEVFGSLEDVSLPPFTKHSNYSPNSPYAASKAASDLLVRSYFKTYNLPAIITNCSNNFGPRQHSEKLIPKILSNLKKGKQIPIYGEGKNIRDWIYVKDHVNVLLNIVKRGKVGDQYLIGGNNEMTNMELVNYILSNYGGKFPKQDEYVKFVEDRKGHDLRYAISNVDLLNEFPDLKFTPFDVAMTETVNYYL